jgi:hypothetical protein
MCDVITRVSWLSDVSLHLKIGLDLQYTESRDKFAAMMVGVHNIFCLIAS